MVNNCENCIKLEQLLHNQIKISEILAKNLSIDPEMALKKAKMEASYEGVFEKR
jgi:hypothetical protein